MSRNPVSSQDHQKPLSPEARAALEERLAALRAQEAQRGTSRPQTAEHVALGASSEGAEHSSPYPNSNRVAEDEDSNDREDEAFMNFIEDTFLDGGASSWTNGSAQNIQQMQCTSGASTQGHDSGGAIYFPPRTRGFRDFEVLWFVKFGDITSFQDHCANQGIAIKTFCDNQNRNALHYVADNGSIPMLQLLLTFGVPYQRSEKGMTPMDVAVLTNQSSEFKALLGKIAKDSNESEGSNLAKEEGKTFEEVRSKFAPEPPKFVISRRPPTPIVFTPNTSERSFWKCQLARKNGEDVAVLNLDVTTKVSDAETGVRVVVNDCNHGDLATGVRATGHLYSGWGLSRFLKPLDYLAKGGVERGVEGSLSSKLAVLTAIPVSEAMAGNSASELPVGVLASMILNGDLEGVGSGTDVSGRRTESSLAVAGYLAVDAAHQGKRVASALMRGLENELLARHGCTALAFTMRTLIPQLPSPTSMIKWYRRAFNASAILKSPFAEDIFPQFYEEDEVLRADCVLKGTLAPMLRDTYVEAVQGWRFVDGADQNQTNAVFDLLHNRGKEGLELVYKWRSAEDLRHTLFSPDDTTHLKSLMRITGRNNAPEDLIVFRLRQMRYQRGQEPNSPTKASVEEGVSGDQGSIVVVQVVYAHFTVLKGAEKMSHILLMAHDLLRADVLLVPNQFGFTESDLVKSNFEEVTMWREMLYVLVKEGQKDEESNPTAEFVPTIPASRVSLPIFLL